MIKFFRKIRHQLLSQNRFSKYMLYSVGEILIVMVGILFALQVNNWNNKKEDSLKETSYLNSLQIEIEKHIDELDKNLIYINDRLHSVDYVLSNLSTPKHQLNVDSMVVHLNLMQWVGGLSLDTNLYQDLINTGNISLIKDENLRLGIQNYFYRISSYRSSTRTNNNFYVHNAISFYMRYLSMGHIIATPTKDDSEGKEPPKRELFELWDFGYFSAEMKEFENNLYFRRTDLDLEVVRNRRLNEMATELIKEIKKYSSQLYIEK